MTKIYLVVFKNEEGRIWDFAVFTNRKKAEQYCRYWNAVARIDPKFRGDRAIISEEPINNMDYTKAANEAEMKLLPF